MKILGLLTLAGLGLFGTGASAATLTVDGALPRDPAGKVDLIVSIDGVTAAEFARAATDPTDPAAQLVARLVLKDATGVLAGDYKIVETRDHKEDVSTDGLHGFKYYVELTDAKVTAPLSLDVSFFLGGQTADKLVAGLKPVNVTLPTILAAVPDTPGTIAGQGQITLLWNPKVGDPASLNAYVIDTTAGATLKLPAYKVNGIAGRPDTSAKCTWDASAGTGDCVTCPANGDHYLDPAAIAKVPGVLVKTVSTLDGEITVTGLTANRKYSVFLQFEPKGAKVGQCMPTFPYGGAYAPPSELTLTPAEQAEVDQHLRDFYGKQTDPNVMQTRPGKYSTANGKHLTPHAFLRLPVPDVNVLKDMAGVKSTDGFLKAKCLPDRLKHFLKSPCLNHELESASESNDSVDDLVDSWVTTPVHSLDDAPSAGTVDVHPWSDDYWRTKYGGLAYRYADGSSFKTYQQAIAYYAQPRDWSTLGTASTDQAQTTLAGWSPAEKYDLVTGDATFALTNEQKGEGANELENGDVPDWVGICEGWSAASIMTPVPKLPVHATAPTGLAVQFYPADIRSLISLSWARGTFDSNDVGGRCDAKAPAVGPNGRLMDQDCFDTNPATYHMALANMIGKAHKSFIMDAAFDSEVWNQSLISYQFTYFNPLDPTQRSSSWSAVAVPYDAAFKAKDRFQTPLTRGVRTPAAAGPPATPEKWDDTAVKKVVGVITTVVYNDEYWPNPAITPTPDQMVRATYTYDLELSADPANANALIPTGGEWQSNAHPDFLWTPRGDTTLTLTGGDAPFSIDQVPSAALGTAAAKASALAQPLCSVLGELVWRSSGSTTDFVVCNK